MTLPGIIQKFFLREDYFEIGERDLIPDSKTPTRLTGSPPPPVTGWEIIDGKFHITQNHKLFGRMLRKVAVCNKSLNTSICDFFKNYSHICFTVIIISIILISVAILLLSILTPETINSIFQPALNIVQTQIICGFGIFIGMALGIQQIINSKFTNTNNNAHEECHGVRDSYDCAI